MPELTTVPSFVFYQGQPGNIDWERPIHVHFYHGTITLEQQTEFDVPDKVMIHPTHLKALFKEILKHQPEAELWLKK